MRTDKAGPLERLLVYGAIGVGLVLFWRAVIAAIPPQMCVPALAVALTIIIFAACSISAGTRDGNTD